MASACFQLGILDNTQGPRRAMGFGMMERILGLIVRLTNEECLSEKQK